MANPLFATKSYRDPDERDGRKHRLRPRARAGGADSLGVGAIIGTGISS